MGDFTNSMKISQTPILAPKNWTEIENDSKKKCGKCKSENTVCIYKYFSGSIIGYTKEDEFYCNDCGYFTLYEIDYDS